MCRLCRQKAEFDRSAKAQLMCNYSKTNFEPLLARMKVQDLTQTLKYTINATKLTILLNSILSFRPYRAVNTLFWLQKPNNNVETISAFFRENSFKFHFKLPSVPRSKHSILVIISYQCCGNNLCFFLRKFF